MLSDGCRVKKGTKSIPVGVFLIKVGFRFQSQCDQGSESKLWGLLAESWGRWGGLTMAIKAWVAQALGGRKRRASGANCVGNSSYDLRQS